jgi:ketol-acid reductoisomerase
MWAGIEPGQTHARKDCSSPSCNNVLVTAIDSPTLYDSDADPDLIRHRRIAVIGYGAQGHAQALNLRDSGCQVMVGLREGGPSVPRAKADGFEVRSVGAASAWGDVIVMLIPDQYHQRAFEDSIRHSLTTGKCLVVAHGFSIHFGFVRPPEDVDVAMVAPVGPGAMLRRLYMREFGIPAEVAVYRDASGGAGDLALSYARALGCTRAGVLRTTFQEETESDLFGEQAVLCGGLTALIKAGFDTLVEAGYGPEMAYFECVHQVKLIVDLIYEHGFASMHEKISDTAEYGDYVTGTRVIDEHVRQSMRAVLADVQNGTFAAQWMGESAKGAPMVLEKRSQEQDSLVEQVGIRLRAMMSGLSEPGEA